MKCPKCGSENSKVLNTRKYDTVVIRRRQCFNSQCLHIWRTSEENTDCELRPKMLAEPSAQI